MLRVSLGKSDAAGAKADLLAVGVFENRVLGPGAEEAVAALETPLEPLLDARGFTGKAVDAVVLRRAAAATVRHAGGAKKAVTTLAQALPGDPALAARAVAEGAVLADYRFDKYKAKANGSDPQRRLSSLVVAPGDGKKGDLAAAV